MLPPGEQLKVRAIEWGVPMALLRRLRAASRYATRRPHEEDFRFFARFGDRPVVFLDVGANLGQSALSFRMFAPRARIVSVEPNVLHEPDLRFVSRLVGNMELHFCAAGAERGRMVLHVPTFHGVPLSGDASLDRTSILGPAGVRRFLADRVEGPHFTIEEQKVDVVLLDELAIAADVIKVDVEGSEAEAVRGLRSTISSRRPVLLVESTSHHEVGRELADLGYLPRRHDPRRRGLVPLEADTVPVNVFFVPEESAADLAQPGPRPPSRFQAVWPSGCGRFPSRRR